MGYVPGTPGVKTERSATPRKILAARDSAMFLPGGLIIDGSASRDPLNVGDVDVLRDGLVMGKITASGKAAPSIVGTLGVAYAGDATQMNILDTTAAAELSRRLGASGTFKITGPKAASGTVRTQTVTYSAVGGGTPVNEVQTITPNEAAASGTYTISVTKADGTRVTTAALAFNATLAAAQTALNLAMGASTNLIVLSTAGSAAPWSAGPIALVFTYSGTGYLRIDQPMATVDSSLLIGASGVITMTGVETTKGVPAANTVTVTALGVAEAQTITPSASPTVGTWQLRYRGDNGVEVESAFLAYNLAAADIQVAVRAMHTDLAAVVVTDSGSAGLSDGTVTVTWPQTGATAGPHSLLQAVSSGSLLATAAPVNLVVSRGATGINGDFIAGSFIQPVDGSETPLCLLFSGGYGIKVTDDSAASIDEQFPTPLIGGQIDASQIINYPSDASLKTWLKQTSLNALGQFVFDDDFGL